MPNLDMSLQLIADEDVCKPDHACDLSFGQPMVTKVQKCFLAHRVTQLALPPVLNFPIAQTLKIVRSAKISWPGKSTYHIYQLVDSSDDEGGVIRSDADLDALRSSPMAKLKLTGCFEKSKMITIHADWEREALFRFVDSVDHLYESFALCGMKNLAQYEDANRWAVSVAERLDTILRITKSEKLTSDMSTLSVDEAKGRLSRITESDNMCKMISRMSNLSVDEAKECLRNGIDLYHEFMAFQKHNNPFSKAGADESSSFINNGWAEHMQLVLQRNLMPCPEYTVVATQEILRKFLQMNVFGTEYHRKLQETVISFNTLSSTNWEERGLHVSLLFFRTAILNMMLYSADPCLERRIEIVRWARDLVYKASAALDVNDLEWYHIVMFSDNWSDYYDATDKRAAVTELEETFSDADQHQVNLTKHTVFYKYQDAFRMLASRLNRILLQQFYARGCTNVTVEFLNRSYVGSHRISGRAFLNLKEKVEAAEYAVVGILMSSEEKKKLVAAERERRKAKEYAYAEKNAQELLALEEREKAQDLAKKNARRSRKKAQRMKKRSCAESPQKLPSIVEDEPTDELSDEPGDETGDQTGDPVPLVGASSTSDASKAIDLSFLEAPSSSNYEEVESSMGGETTCIICFTNEKTHMATPCAHLCVCHKCHLKLKNCPYCRADVQLWIKPIVV